MKNYDNLIIKCDDPRYGKLGHIWKKYNWENIIVDWTYRSWRYLIPKELNILTKSDIIVSCKSIYNNLVYYCDLTTNEFFDLVVLHINNKSNRPRCSLPNCNELIPFISYSQGYGHLGYWNPNIPHFCCNSHQRYFHEDYNKLMLNSVIPTIRRQRSTFITKSKGSIGLVYVTRTNSGSIKYGVTENIENRSFSIGFGGFYINPHIIFIGDIIEAANLEAQIKLEFNGNEYLTESQLHKLFKVIKSKLAIRPIANPFD